MSTAKKTTIKFTAFVTLLIVTVAYFSLLSPTSAYFYKEFPNDDAKIKFANFEVNQVLFENEASLRFPGATKLADFEEFLFDDVAIVKTITIKNEGDAPARILTQITPDEEAEKNGLRYIAFIETKEAESTTGEEVATVAEDESTTEAESTTSSAKPEKGSVKAELESFFNITEISSDVTNREEVENSVASSVEVTLEEYNENFRNNYNNVLDVNEEATVKIIFWSEYDTAQTAAGGESVWQEAGSIKDLTYDCNIKIIATQVDENYAAVTAAVSELAEENKESTNE